MTKQPLKFKRLSILRMPGLPRGLQDYKDFAAHINIVIGPNGSGKTSTARAIKELIWRHASGEVTADALMNLDGEEWELKLDGHKASAWRNGEDIPLTGIPALEGAGRYTLALHELVVAKDGDLARQVLTDSTGYDLNAAQQALRYTLGAYSTRTNEFRDFVAAKNNYDEIFKTQDALKREQDKLAGLIKDKNNAERAAALLDWNRQLLEFAQAKRPLAEAQMTFSAMPTVLDILTGEEYEDLKDTQGQLADLEDEIKGLEGAISEAKVRRAALNFPEIGLSDTLLEILDAKITRFAEIERGVSEHDKEIAKASSKELSALKLLGDVDHTGDWSGVTWIDVDILGDYLQKAHSLLSRKTAIEAFLIELQRSTDQSTNLQSADVMTGIQTLTAWLQEYKPKVENKIPVWSLWLIVLLAILSVLGVWFFGKVGLMVGTVCIFVATIIIYFLNKKTVAETASVRERDYMNIGLPEPSEWTIGPVQKKLAELVNQLERTTLQQLVNSRIETQKGELNGLQPDLEEMDQKYKRLEDQLKLVPAAPVGDPRSFDAMYWFLHYSREWHEHYSQRLALESAHEVLEKEKHEVLTDINTLFATGNTGPATDATSAKILLQQLAKRDRAWKDTGTEMENASRSLDDRNRRKILLTTKLHGIYTKTGIEEGMDGKVKELISQLTEYSHAKQNCLSQSKVLEDKERVLRLHKLYPECGTELNNITIEEIEAKLPALSDQAAYLEQIKNEITAINTKIELAESGNNLEIALKEKDNCLAALENLYDQNLSVATGKLLIDGLKKQAGDRDRPPVFKLANTIFNRITNGKYQLRLNSEEPPAFGAFDNIEGQWRDLEKLSTGTRIQLLLSVRLAFIDSLESSVSVPIIADELLANSDNQRASAIVDALAEISREGRQIFYFTSQEEEVLKWQTLLADKSEISHSVYRLDGHDSESYTLAQVRLSQEFAGAHLLTAIPEVGELNHAQYGKVLRVGVYDLMSDLPERLHVWYLFDDSQIVYALLNEGIRYWGQLRSYISFGGRFERLDKAILEEVESKVRVLERFQQLYQKGRPRRINRSVLENSGAVTGTFIDAVSEKLEELGNDPLQLLDSLANKIVPGFRANNLERLRDYLSEEGYISEEIELSPEEIWVQLAAFISQSSISLEEARRFIARIVVE